MLPQSSESGGSAARPDFQVSSFYMREASLYDAWDYSSDSQPAIYNRLRFEKIMRVLPRGPRRVLEIGSGDGILARALAERGYNVIATDLSTLRLTRVRRRSLGLPVNCVATDALKLPFADTSADVVVASEVIEHIPDYFGVLSEVQRVLKPGGMLVVTVPYKEKIRMILCPHCLQTFPEYGHLHSFDEGILGAALKSAGLGVEKVYTFTNFLSFLLKRAFGLNYRVYSLLDQICSSVVPSRNHYMLTVARKDLNEDR
jgi:ubiquinone/menaquinone biosynthesis C-methylase UbiE